MAIRLTQEQIYALEGKTDLIWRPYWARILHIQDLEQPNRAIEAKWTLCGELRPAAPSWHTWSWTDPFCAKCVKAALR